MDSQVRAVRELGGHVRCSVGGCKQSLRPSPGLRLGDWGAVAEQWRRARLELQLVGSESAKAPARTVLTGAVPLPKIGHVTCNARFGRQELLYVQVYKSNTLGVCGNVARLLKLADNRTREQVRDGRLRPPANTRATAT